MDHLNGDGTPADLTHMAERLRSERASATPLELDELKQRAMRQAARTTPNQLRQKGSWMKSRIALTMMIVAGLMLSTTGATLAISGSSGNGNAATNQYRQVEPNDEEDGTILGQDQGGGETQPVEQVAATGGGSSLPFTGFFTIPLILAGVGLLAVGGTLRWKTRE